MIHFNNTHVEYIRLRKKHADFRLKSKFNILQKWIKQTVYYMMHICSF